jgi:hypothetical protein
MYIIGAEPMDGPIHVGLNLSELAAVYGETSTALGADLRRGNVPGIPPSVGNPGKAGRKLPLEQAVTLGLFTWMRRRTPGNRRLGERAAAVAPGVTRWFLEALQGRRPSAGNLLIIEPPGGREGYALGASLEDMGPMLERAAEVDARVEIVPLLPVLQPLMIAIAKSEGASEADMRKVALGPGPRAPTMPAASATGPGVVHTDGRMARFNVDSGTIPCLRLDDRGLAMCAPGVGLLWTMGACGWRELARLGTGPGTADRGLGRSGRPWSGWRFERSTATTAAHTAHETTSSRAKTTTSATSRAPTIMTLSPRQAVAGSRGGAEDQGAAGAPGIGIGIAIGISTPAVSREGRLGTPPPRVPDFSRAPRAAYLALRCTTSGIGGSLRLPPPDPLDHPHCPLCAAGRPHRQRPGVRDRGQGASGRLEVAQLPAPR